MIHRHEKSLVEPIILPKRQRLSAALSIDVKPLMKSIAFGRPCIPLTPSSMQNKPPYQNKFNQIVSARNQHLIVKWCICSKKVQLLRKGAVHFFVNLSDGATPSLRLTGPTPPSSACELPLFCACSSH